MAEIWSPERCAEVRDTLERWAGDGDFLVGVGNRALVADGTFYPKPLRNLALDYDDQPILLPEGGVVRAYAGWENAVFTAVVLDRVPPRTSGIRRVRDSLDPSQIHTFHLISAAARGVVARLEAGANAAEGDFPIVCRISPDDLRRCSDRAWDGQSKRPVRVGGIQEVSAAVLGLSLYELPSPESNPNLVAAFRANPF